MWIKHGENTEGVCRELTASCKALSQHSPTGTEENH